uniref:HMA domain-containing protein n=2 Tax=Quercus lobata TaxID=97700 RepID=A0A7N2M8P4_QUELO
MTCEKCRIKAMKIASNTNGVISVAVEGSDKDQLVVIGEGVDSANLTSSLRKQLSNGAAILSVEEVKEKEKPAEEKEKPKEDKNPNNPEEHALVFHQYPPVPMFCEVVYDPDPSFCSIM